jgi:hypothetical protein
VHIKLAQAAATEAERLRNLRLAALKDAPYAYGAKYEVDKEKPITFWQQLLADSNWFFTSTDGVDIGLIGVENLPRIGAVIVGFLAGGLSNHFVGRV